jgi:hypothetical protein
MSEYLLLNDCSTQQVNKSGKMQACSSGVSMFSRYVFRHISRFTFPDIHYIIADSGRV